MRNSMNRILVVSVVIGLAACLAWAPPAVAADRTFTLFGDDDAPGWGLDPGNITNPGPTLVVDLGDNVTLMLTGADPTNLRWYIDYDNNSNDDPGEPRSPMFDSGNSPLQWNFTADTPGTFTYREVNNPDTMNGTITIRNVTAPPGGTPFSLDANLYIVVGLVVAFVAVLAILSMYGRRKQQKHEKKA